MSSATTQFQYPCLLGNDMPDITGQYPPIAAAEERQGKLFPIMTADPFPMPSQNRLFITHAPVNLMEVRWCGKAGLP
jgi:hypothetical protein